MEPTKIKMIFACTSEDHVFGNADKLPWSQHIKKDIEIFKEYTSNSVLVMGRKTFESLPCRLRDLQHIVVTREVLEGNIKNKKGQNPDFVVASLSDAIWMGLDLIEQHLYFDDEPNLDICIIGGADILLEASEFVDDAMITEVTFKDPKRYYDAPRYIDLQKIKKNLINSEYIDIDSSKTAEFDINIDEIKSITLYNFRPNYTNKTDLE